MRIYRNLREAHEAACLDAGFDPFLVPKKRRVTRSALAAMGYVVGTDREEASTGREQSAVIDTRWIREIMPYPVDERAQQQQAKADAEYSVGIGRAVAAAIRAGLLTARDHIRPEWSDDYQHVRLVRQRGGVVVYDRGAVRLHA